MVVSWHSRKKVTTKTFEELVEGLNAVYIEGADQIGEVKSLSWRPLN